MCVEPTHIKVPLTRRCLNGDRDENCFEFNPTLYPLSPFKTILKYHYSYPVIVEEREKRSSSSTFGVSMDRKEWTICNRSSYTSHRFVLPQHLRLFYNIHGEMETYSDFSEIFSIPMPLEVTKRRKIVGSSPYQTHPGPILYSTMNPYLVHGYQSSTLNSMGMEWDLLNIHLSIYNIMPCQLIVSIWYQLVAVYYLIIPKTTTTKLSN